MFVKPSGATGNIKQSALHGFVSRFGPWAFHHVLAERALVHWECFRRDEFAGTLGRDAARGSDAAVRSQ